MGCPLCAAKLFEIKNIKYKKITKGILWVPLQCLSHPLPKSYTSYHPIHVTSASNWFILPFVLRWLGFPALRLLPERVKKERERERERERETDRQRKGMLIDITLHYKINFFTILTNIKEAHYQSYTGYRKRKKKAPFLQKQKGTLHEPLLMLLFICLSTNRNDSHHYR